MTVPLDIFVSKLNSQPLAAGDVEKQTLLFRNIVSLRDKFLNVKLQTQIGPVMSLNPILSDWYDPVKEGAALYKTLLLDPEDRVKIANIVRERMSEKTTWWIYCGIPSEPRKATSEEAAKYQEAMKDGQAFVAKETNTQRKLREVYGLYCSLQEVPGVVHFDEFAPPEFGANVQMKVTEANTINGGAEIPSAVWWPAWLGLSSVEEEPKSETTSAQTDRSAITWMRNQQMRRAAAKWEFELYHSECSRRRKAAIAELQGSDFFHDFQRDALLLSCAASQLSPEVKGALKEGVQDFFALENALLSTAKF